MRLTQLALNNLRNHESWQITPQDKIIALIGPNGSGKTNILEGIFLTAMTKSFRDVEEEEIFRWNTDTMSIKAELVENEETTLLELNWTKNPLRRKLRRNGIEEKVLDFVGQLSVVLFCPDDINLLSFAPNFRRRYINFLLGSLHRPYRAALAQYHKVLKNRNALLRAISEQKASPTELTFWNSELATHALTISSRRVEATQYFNQYLSAAYSALSGDPSTLEIQYHNRTGGRSQEEILTRLQQDLATDLRLGSTSCGPHRDDFAFILNGKNIIEHGSRGEARSVIISLKQAEISYIKDVSGHQPLVLLDDVFSELDDRRQHALLSLFTTEQIWITGTTWPEGVAAQRVSFFPTEDSF